jgi:hypothetical protein
MIEKRGQFIDFFYKKKCGHVLKFETGQFGEKIDVEK